MTLIDNYPNAERTLTTIETSLITKKEYQKLKNISAAIKKTVESNLDSDINSYGIVKYYVEQTIRSSNTPLVSKPSEKEIIISNIILPDDIEVAELLTQNKYTLEHLKAMIRFRSSLKNLILNDVQIDKETEQKLQVYKKFVTSLIALFKQRFGIDDQTVILNKICEMLVYYPHYFESKLTDHVRKR